MIVRAITFRVSTTMFPKYLSFIKGVVVMYTNLALGWAARSASVKFRRRAAYVASAAGSSSRLWRPLLMLMRSQAASWYMDVRRK